MACSFIPFMLALLFFLLVLSASLISFFPNSKILTEDLSEVAIRDWIEFRQNLQTQNKTETQVACSACERSVAVVQRLFVLKQGWALSFAKAVCIISKIANRDVCDGSISRYGSILLSVFASRVLDPVSICSTLHFCTISDDLYIYLHPTTQSDELWLHLNLTEDYFHPSLNSNYPPLLKTINSSENRHQFESSPINITNVIEKLNEERHEFNPFFSERRFLNSILPSVSAIESEKIRDGHGSKFRSHLKMKVKSSQEPNMTDPAIGHFIQITDIHFDMNYSVGSSVRCDYPICCRSAYGYPLSSEQAAQTFGDFNCDLPQSLLTSALDFISNEDNFPKLNFIIYTGDTVPHTIWEDTLNSTSSVMLAVNQQLKDAFPRTPIYPILGNHDIVPADELRLSKGNNFSGDFVWQMWKEFLPSECEQSVREGGYYSLLHEEGFRIVGLNSMWCDIMNFWLLEEKCLYDPANQLQWLERTLTEAKRKNESVLIMGHIAIGSMTCFSDYSQRYIELIQKFESTVVAQLFGHSHCDDFKILSQTNFTDPVGVALVCPSLTPLEGHNPAFRLFSYNHISSVDDDDGSGDGNDDDSSLPPRVNLINYWQYILDLVRANNLQDSSDWVITYNALDQYGLTSLSASEWSRLVQNFENEPYLFQIFLDNLHARVPYECESSCMLSRFCSLVTSSMKDNLHCLHGKDNSLDLFISILMNLLNC